MCCKFSNDVDNKFSFPLTFQRLILVNNIPLWQCLVLVHNIIKIFKFPWRNVKKSNLILREITNSKCIEVRICCFSQLRERLQPDQLQICLIACISTFRAQVRFRNIISFCAFFDIFLAYMYSLWMREIDWRLFLRKEICAKPYFHGSKYFSSPRAILMSGRPRV